MRIAPVLIATFLTLGGTSPGQELKTDSFFERLDTNRDGKLTLDEAPEQGKMLVEFLLNQSGKKGSGHLDRGEFMRLTSRPARRPSPAGPRDKAVAAAIGAGNVQPDPENCPACALGLTAESVFNRLDLDEDKLITVTEFLRSPGMQDLTKAREVVERLDKSGDGKLSWGELETVYKARHANCKKRDRAALAANARRVGPDGRGDGNRFSQVFILRSDKNGDGKISREEFRGPDFGFNRLDKNENGFVEADELGDLHQRRLNDPKSMKERLESGDVPKPPQGKRPKGLGDPQPKTE